MKNKNMDYFTDFKNETVLIDDLNLFMNPFNKQKFDRKSSKVCSFDPLICWEVSESGFISPANFITKIEALIYKIGVHPHIIVFEITETIAMQEYSVD